MTNSKQRKKDLKTLDLENDATKEDIKLAYRKMARKTHPDFNKNDPEASQKFQKVKQAYNDLTQSKEKKISKKTRNSENFWTWGELDSLFQEIFLNDVFFGLRGKEKSYVPISQPETFVDLKELVRRKKRNQDYF